MAKVIIIGAGPAGLATAGRLRLANIDFEVLESTQSIASSWRGHYDRLHLHTVKQFSNLPGLPFPAEYPLYVPRDLFIEYCESYAKHFKIQPHFGSKGIEVEKAGDNWRIKCSNGKPTKVKGVLNSCEILAKK